MGWSSRVRGQADHGPVDTKPDYRERAGEHGKQKRRKALEIVFPTTWGGCLVTSYKLTGIWENEL